MAGSNYGFDKSNPFFSSEDVDDATFLAGRKPYESSTLQERSQQLLEERRKIEERTLQSSYRSIGLLRESESVGTATAEELNRQREALQNTEQKLDEISSTLHVSQRHIQGIKSVFGSIRNYFAGKNDGSKLPTSGAASNVDTPSHSDGPSILSQILETKTESRRVDDIHPTERFRSEGPTTSEEVDSVLDKNLDAIGVSLSRLKHLGLDLNTEITDQNVMLDRITRKTEDVDFKVEKQTKEMNRILKK